MVRAERRRFRGPLWIVQVIQYGRGDWTNWEVHFTQNLEGRPGVTVSLGELAEAETQRWWLRNKLKLKRWSLKFCSEGFQHQSNLSRVRYATAEKHRHKVWARHLGISTEIEQSPFDWRAWGSCLSGKPLATITSVASGVSAAKWCAILLMYTLLI